MTEPGWDAGTLVVSGRRIQGLVDRACRAIDGPGEHGGWMGQWPDGQWPEPWAQAPWMLSEGELAEHVYQRALCVVSRVDPDQWYPMATDEAKARDEAAAAIAVCIACPVRAHCLEFALRHGSGAGAHGVWGGLVEAERAPLRRRWRAGTTVAQLLEERPGR